MKRTIAFFIILVSVATVIFAEDMVRDENRSFYTGNVYYEKKDYPKALENYRAALDMGLESGSLYYNIANTYLKMGKIGYAVLFYEKAVRLMPQDGDLKSNLAYARTFAPGSSPSRPSGFEAAAAFIKSPFDDFNLNVVAIVSIGVYIFTVILAMVFLVNPFLVRKLKIVFWIMVVVTVWCSVVFGIRYYNEEFLKKGIVVAKAAEAKYEPVESSTVYYKVQEGDEVTILATRDGWRHIKRSDGKTAWVDEKSVEDI